MERDGRRAGRGRMLRVAQGDVVRQLGEHGHGEGTAGRPGTHRIG